MYPPTNALNKIHFITIIKTASCFVTGVPSSGRYRTKVYKSNMLVQVLHCPVLKCLKFKNSKIYKN
jgi:hypothetical protein